MAPNGPRAALECPPRSRVVSEPLGGRRGLPCGWSPRKPQGQPQPRPASRWPTERSQRLRRPMWHARLGRSWRSSFERELSPLSSAGRTRPRGGQPWQPSTQPSALAGSRSLLAAVALREAHDDVAVGLAWAGPSAEARRSPATGPLLEDGPALWSGETIAQLPRGTHEAARGPDGEKCP
jgi:hypothetical protein